VTRRVALLGAFVALLASEIHAEPRASAHLEWTRPPGAESCSDVSVIERLVEERLGRSVFVDAAQADVAVRGSFEPNGRGYRALVVMSHGEEALGERVLTTESTDCHELDAATALVLAVAIESVTVKRVELALPKVPEPSAKTSAKVVTPPAASEALPEEPWRGEITAGGAFAVGLLPKPAFGFAVGSVVTPPRFLPLRFDVRVWFPRDDDLERGGASFSAWQAGLAACPVLLSELLVLEACGGANVGVLSATGFGLDRNARASGVLVDFGVDGRGTLAQGRVRPWIEVGAEVPLIRDRFRVIVDGERTELHRVSPVFFVARLGGLLAIP
jgi:hypothetical protein